MGSLHTPAFDVAKVELDEPYLGATISTNDGEIQGAAEMKIVFLPPNSYKRHSYMLLRETLSAMQEIGKGTAARLKLSTVDDVYRYLNEK